MLQLRSALIAAAATLALSLIAVPAAGAFNGTSFPTPVRSFAPLETVHVTGVAKNGKTFRGTFGIQRFVAGATKVYAVGTLKGRLNGRHVTRYGVMIPASMTGASGSARDAQASCTVLHLVLGPVALNLLGLPVTLGGGPSANQPIVLDVTAVPGPGNLQGNLLCDLTNALNQGGLLSSLNSQLQQLAATLNSLVGLLGGL
jgi:hypothetical protein